MKIVAATLLLGATAHADPLVLSANALATTASPAGLVTVSANAAATDHVSVEAVVWTGGGGDLTGDFPGDVLVMVIRARTEDGMASGQLGRYVATLGALRPIQIDGAGGRVRLPHRFAVEAFAGVPVLRDPTLSRAWDWAVAGRVSRQIGDSGSIGIAYLQQREYGRLAAEEVGVDGGVAIGEHDDVAAKLAYDLANPGVAEATLTASHRRGALRSELFATYRAASHLLPGDVVVLRARRRAFGARRHDADLACRAATRHHRQHRAAPCGWQSDRWTCAPADSDRDGYRGTPIDRRVHRAGRIHPREATAR